MAASGKTNTLLGKFPSLSGLRASAPGAGVRHARAMIADREAAVRAWAYLAPDAAPEADILGMAASDRPLAGVPFGVKDVIDVAGMPTACGSPASDGRPAAFNAACVEMLIQAGGVPLGKTVTAEYAFRHPGPTRNPANPAHTPGGSSSGSAAAVAAGMVPLALSTQTGGSIIRPAAYCGVPGFKPSFGLLSRDGLKLTCDSLDVIGWHGADIGWIGAAAEALLPAAGAPSNRALKNAKVAVIDGSAEGAASEEAQAVMKEVACVLERSGANCMRVDAAAQLAALAHAHAVIMKYEFARTMQPVVSARGKHLSAALWENVRQGWAVTHGEYREMRALQRELRASWAGFTQGADFILAHSAAGEAPEGHAFTGAPIFNKCWSVLGWPCLHLPVRMSRRGLPLGVQMIGRFEGDFDLIAYAAQLESEISIGGEQT